MFHIDNLQKAWQLASKLHDGQKYGGHEPDQYIEYINHIGSVAFEVMQAVANTPGMDAELAISCALLHDTLEDTELPYDALLEKFGTRIAHGVRALTKNDAILDKEEKMLDSLQRIRQQPKEVWAVKLADRICNLAAPPFYWAGDKTLAYQNEARLILQELKGGNAYLEDRLAQKIRDYGFYIK